MSASPDPDDLIRGHDRLLTSGEVAQVFRVDPRTVARWSKPGDNGEPPRLPPATRTPGGHRRYRMSEVRALIQGDSGHAGA